MKNVRLTTWDNAFAPILAQGREMRDGQKTLGNAIIEVVNKGGNLIAECSTGTGKSYGTLLPAIIKTLESRESGKRYRAVVSTETLTLQDQIYKKDLPFLSTIYPGFVYAKLMGRSNYFCFEAAKDNAIGVGTLDALVQKLERRKADIGTGERSDVERVLGRKLTTDEWSKLSGSSSFCGDNQCTVERCYGTLARKKAKEADIVVANHAILATDLEIKLNATTDSAAEDGLLGTIDALIVDEAHQLSPVLTDQWSKELTMWEITALSGSVSAGIEIAQAVLSNASIGRLTQESLDDIVDAFTSIQKFFTLLCDRDGVQWGGSTHALAEKMIMRGAPQYIIHAMKEYEEVTPDKLEEASVVLDNTVKYLNKAMKIAVEEKLKNKKKISKGMRAANDLMSTVKLVAEAIRTKDGIVSNFGIYGATIKGWEKRDGTQGMTLRMLPMDISAKAQYLFHNKTNILVSATLTDLTDGTFKYVKASTGFPAGAKELRVTTPFDLLKQQLFYMTPATGQRVDHLRGAQFSFDELLSVLNAARGRSLVLFTSREELDWASSEVVKLRNAGKFNYPVLIQEKDADKDELMTKFKSDTDSVLFATKSFFVGIDVPGDALSGVWICKWPNPQYNAECRQQVTYWRMRGFPNWYERESLTTFQQAAGRLIRSSGCKGVVGILDFRVSDAKQSVYKSALTGVKAIGSPVTISVDDVKNFFSTV